MVAKASGPLDSLAKPCCMKPNPTIRRSGMGAQRAIANRLDNSKGKARDICMVNTSKIKELYTNPGAIGPTFSLTRAKRRLRRRLRPRQFLFELKAASCSKAIYTSHQFAIARQAEVGPRRERAVHNPRQTN